MADKYATPEMRSAFAAWARARGISAPSNPRDMQRLVAQFVVDMMGQIGGAQLIGGGMPAMDQMGHAENHINLLRDSGGMTEISDPETEDSDFNDLIRQRHDAMEQAGGDDLAAAAIMGKQNQAAAAAAAPATNTNPPSAASSVLGGSIKMQAGDPPTEVARWTGENTESTNVTVTIGPAKIDNIPLQFGVVFQARPYAIIQWGTQALLLSATVDAARGVQLTIGASMVSVQMAMQPLAPFSPLVIGISVKPVPLLLSGMISFRQIEKNKPLTYTWYSSSFSTFGVNAPTIPIPPFATSFKFFCSDSTAVVDFTIDDLGTATQYVAVALSGDAAKAQKIDLAGSSISLFPKNGTGDIATDAGTIAYVVFELGL